MDAPLRKEYARYAGNKSARKPWFRASYFDPPDTLFVRPPDTRYEGVRYE